MLDGKIEAGDILPPSCLAAKQVPLSLKVLKALIIGDYDEILS